MISTALQPQYKTRINVRPVKHAYFVLEDDMENLIRVLRYVCTQWGGIENLIIPVRPDLTIDPFFKSILQQHEPDLFVGFLREPRKRDYRDHDVIQGYLCGLFPHRMISLSDDETFIEYDSAMHPLGAFPQDELRSNKLFVHNFAGPETDQWLLLSALGAIYEGQYKDYASETTLESREVTIDSLAFWEDQFDSSPFSSVLNFTSYGIAPYYAEGGMESNAFDVVLVNSFNSLCMYWNLRATREAQQFHNNMGRRILLLPDRLLSDKSALEEMVNFIQAKLPHRYFESNLHLHFIIWDQIAREKLSAAIEGLEKLENSTEKRITVNMKMGTLDENEVETSPKDKTVKYTFGRPGFARDYREGAGRQATLNVQLNYGSSEVIFTPPEGFNNRNRQVTVQDIECDVWQRYPKDHQTAQSILEGGWFSRYGFSYLAHTPDRPSYVYFKLPEEWDTVKHYFAVRGYEVRRSPDGLYADSIVSLVGGIERIDDLATKPAYTLLDTLALKSTKKIAQRLISRFNLPEDSTVDIQKLLTEIEVVPELKRVPKTLRQLTSGVMKVYQKELLNLLSRLSEKQIIKRGFHLPCPNCGTPSWYPLQTIQEAITCPGCSSEFPLPVEQPRGNEVQWEYTLNTLVNRVMDQDALPAVLALRHLTKNKQACCLIPGLELVQSGNVKAEIDFLFISNQQIIAGECKAGVEIGDKDIETARLAARLGVRQFYYCTISRFSETSQQRITTLKQEFESNSIQMFVSSLNGDELLGEAIVYSESTVAKREKEKQVST
jgi:hypothetical protein